MTVPWAQHMVDSFMHAGDELIAVLSNGDLMAAPSETLVWRRILTGSVGVWAVASPACTWTGTAGEAEHVLPVRRGRVCAYLCARSRLPAV